MTWVVLKMWARKMGDRFQDIQKMGLDPQLSGGRKESILVSNAPR